MLSIVQTIVVVASLYALWHQLRQFNQNMQYEAYTRHMDDYSRLTEILIEKPELNQLFYCSNSDFAKLENTEKDYYNYLGLAVGFLERLYMFHQKRWSDEQTWVAWELWVTEQWFPQKVFDIFWKNEGHYFVKPFYEWLNKKYLAYKTNQNSLPNKPC